MVFFYTCNPTTTLGAYKRFLTEAGFPVTKYFLQRLFRKWHWTWKKPSKIQKHKFTKANIDAYLEWLVVVFELPWFQLKFMDEVHCVSKDLSRSHVLGRSGVTPSIILPDSLGDTLSMTLLLDLSNTENPFGVEMRLNSNTQWDFLQFIINMVAQQRLKRGDYLILDNATIHKAKDTKEAFQVLMDIVGVKVLYLPKYSPEFNPCELVFALVKNYLRWYRESSLPLWVELLHALARIEYVSLLGFFWKCTQQIRAYL